jgi:hypothetical protein
MWAITNQTRFKAERTFARDADGAEVWVVAVRATFSIASNGQVAVAEKQDDVCLAPKYFGEPGRSSLRYDADLVRTKPGTDVILHAQAYAPYGRPVPFVDVSWTVGSLSKQLRVVGDRVWRNASFNSGSEDLVPSDPQPFLSCPISYERAWGGISPGDNAPDPSNPAGIGADAASGKPVPNVEYPVNPIRSSRHNGPPAGFGPVPCEWQPRLTLAGTYDEIWQNERQPLVPNDFQDSYFRCAPGDQQVMGFLKGGEEAILRNLTPEGLLRFRLPQISLGFSTRIAGGATHHRGQLHTVIIEPEDRRLVMIWQTSLPCHHSLYALRETVVFEKERVLVAVQDEPEAALVA